MEIIPDSTAEEITILLVNIKSPGFDEITHLAVKNLNDEIFLPE